MTSIINLIRENVHGTGRGSFFPLATDVYVLPSNTQPALLLLTTAEVSEQHMGTQEQHMRTQHYSSIYITQLCNS